jgi:ribosome-associated protein
VLVVNSRLRIPLRELRFTFVRSSGPGGQHVNKASTKAVLRWSIATSPSLPESVRERFMERYRRRLTADGDVVISSQRFRDRGRNVADCIEKLRRMLEEVATPPRRRKPTRPSRAAVDRRLKTKKLRSRRKELRRRPRSAGDPG